jgi:hypothetical protein
MVIGEFVLETLSVPPGYFFESKPMKNNGEGGAVAVLYSTTSTGTLQYD